MTSRLLPLAPWPGATPARLGLLPHSQSWSLMPPSPNGLVGPSFFPAIKPSSDIEISNTTFPVSRRLRSGLRPVEQGVGVRQIPGAAPIDRIGVENLVVEGEEDAETMLFTLRAVGGLAGQHLGLGPIVVFDRCHVGVERDVEVVVEVAAERGEPRDAPPLLRLVGDRKSTRLNSSH